MQENRKMKELQVPNALQTAMHLLETAGYEVYLVGGCVRDALLGQEAADFDLTTNALPAQVATVFCDHRVVETGLVHGTLTVILDGLSLEITTYRTESAYSDGRHPDAVRFTSSLQEDLARRDFTMNAMAYHPQKGLIDPFGGERDLRTGCIRCVGEAAVRFGEDALRMLRALRFAATFDFVIEAATDAALHAQKHRLSCVAAERVRVELTRLLCGKSVERIVLDYFAVLAVVLPPLLPLQGFDQRSHDHCYDLLHHTARALAHTPRDAVLRWAVLLHDIGKPDCLGLDAEGFYGHSCHSAALADELLQSLRFDRASRERIVDLIMLYDMPMGKEEHLLRRCLSQLGEEKFFQLLVVKRADNFAQAPEYRDRLMQYDEMEKQARQILQEMPCLDLKSLAVKGTDLLELGLHGPALGDALQYLLEVVLDGTENNEKIALLKLIKRQKQGKMCLNLNAYES